MITTQLRQDVEALRKFARREPLTMPSLEELRAIADRIGDMAEELHRCGTHRLDVRRASRPQAADAAPRTCLHASVLTEFGSGTRDDPYVIALSIGPVGGVREVMLVKRAELARVLFP